MREVTGLKPNRIWSMGSAQWRYAIRKILVDCETFGPNEWPLEEACT